MLKIFAYIYKTLCFRNNPNADKEKRRRAKEGKKGNDRLVRLNPLSTNGLFFWFDTITLGWSIVYMEGSQAMISNKFV